MPQQHKRPRTEMAGRPNGTIVLNFLVPGESVGWLIGKKGSKITSIQQSTGCEVSFEDSDQVYIKEDPAERKVTVVSTRTEANSRAQLQLTASVCESQQKNPSPDLPCSLKLLVPPDIVSGLIGKQGANVKRITSATQATVQFFKPDEMAEDITDRVCLITGPMQAVNLAQQMLSDLQFSFQQPQAPHSQPPSSLFNPHQHQQHQQHQQPPYQHQYNQSPFRSQSPFPSQPQQPGPYQRPPMQPGMGGGLGGGPLGMPPGRGGPPHTGLLPSMMQDRGSAYPLAANGGSGAGGPGGSAAAGGGPESNIKMEIPSDMVSRVIGKGGQGLKGIIRDCNNLVGIQIEKEDFEAGWREVNITGPLSLANQAQAAVLHRMQSICEVPSWVIRCVPADSASASAASDSQ